MVWNFVIGGVAGWLLANWMNPERDVEKAEERIFAMKRSGRWMNALRMRNANRSMQR